MSDVMDEQQQHLTVPDRCESIVFTPPMNFQDLELLCGESATETTGVTEIKQLPTPEEVVAALSASLHEGENAMELKTPVVAATEEVPVPISETNESEKGIINSTSTSKQTDSIRAPSSQVAVTEVAIEEVPKEASTSEADAAVDIVTTSSTEVSVAVVHEGGESVLTATKEESSEVPVATTPVAVEAVADSPPEAPTIAADISAVIGIDSPAEVTAVIEPDTAESVLTTTVQSTAEVPIDITLITSETVAEVSASEAGVAPDIVLSSPAEVPVAVVSEATESALTVQASAEVPLPLISETLEAVADCLTEVPAIETGLPVEQVVARAEEVPVAADPETKESVLTATVAATTEVSVSLTSGTMEAILDTTTEVPAILCVSPDLVIPPPAEIPLAVETEASAEVSVDLTPLTVETVTDIPEEVPAIQGGLSTDTDITPPAEFPVVVVPEIEESVLTATLEASAEIPLAFTSETVEANPDSATKVPAVEEIVLADKLIAPPAEVPFEVVPVVVESVVTGTIEPAAKVSVASTPLNDEAFLDFAPEVPSVEAGIGSDILIAPLVEGPVAVVHGDPESILTATGRSVAEIPVALTQITAKTVAEVSVSLAGEAADIVPSSPAEVPVAVVSEATESALTVQTSAEVPLPLISETLEAVADCLTEVPTIETGLPVEQVVAIAEEVPVAADPGTKEFVLTTAVAASTEVPITLTSETVEAVADCPTEVAAIESIVSTDIIIPPPAEVLNAVEPVTPASVVTAPVQASTEFPIDLTSLIVEAATDSLAEVPAIEAGISVEKVVAPSAEVPVAVESETTASILTVPVQASAEVPIDLSPLTVEAVTGSETEVPESPEALSEVPVALTSETVEAIADSLPEVPTVEKDASVDLIIAPPAEVPVEVVPESEESGLTPKKEDSAEVLIASSVSVEAVENFPIESPAGISADIVIAPPTEVPVDVEPEIIEPVLAAPVQASAEIPVHSTVLTVEPVTNSPAQAEALESVLSVEVPIALPAEIAVAVVPEQEDSVEIPIALTPETVVAAADSPIEIQAVEEDASADLVIAPPVEPKTVECVLTSSVKASTEVPPHSTILTVELVTSAPSEAPEVELILSADMAIAPLTEVPITIIPKSVESVLIATVETTAKVPADVTIASVESVADSSAEVPAVESNESADIVKASPAEVCVAVAPEAKESVLIATKEESAEVPVAVTSVSVEAVANSATEVPAVEEGVSAEIVIAPSAEAPEVGKSVLTTTIEKPAEFLAVVGAISDSKTEAPALNPGISAEIVIPPPAEIPVAVEPETAESALTASVQASAEAGVIGEVVIASPLEVSVTVISDTAESDLPATEEASAEASTVSIEAVPSSPTEVPIVRDAIPIDTVTVTSEVVPVAVVPDAGKSTVSALLEASTEVPVALSIVTSEAEAQVSAIDADASVDGVIAQAAVPATEVPKTAESIGTATEETSTELTVALTPITGETVVEVSGIEAGVSDDTVIVLPEEVVLSPKLDEVKPKEIFVSDTPLPAETISPPIAPTSPNEISAVATIAEVASPVLDDNSNVSAPTPALSGFSITLDTPLPVVASVLQSIGERIKDQKRRNQEVIDRLNEIEKIIGVPVN